jgi:hypothetical protein
MSKSRANLEKKLGELIEDLKKVNGSFPSIEKLDGWIPREVLIKKGVIRAAESEKGKIMKYKLKIENGKPILKEFKPEGVWKEIYDLLVQRRKILREMENLIKERWNELTIDLKKVNRSFPSVEKLDGWHPIFFDEKRREVYAEKRVDGKLETKVFKPVGIWKKIFELKLSREKILNEYKTLGETLTKYKSIWFIRDAVTRK